MQLMPTKIGDVVLIKPTVYSDDRGWFMEGYNEQQFCQGLKNLGLAIPSSFVQDNHSCSKKGVLRGLHYQNPPFSQGKLVRCVVGTIFDVAVDLRKKSPTYGKWIGLHLSAENQYQLWIPEGFAHGFFTLSETAELLYKTTNYYNKTSEVSILWNDKNINIDWPVYGEPILAEKDRYGISLNDLQRFELNLHEQ